MKIRAELKSIEKLMEEHPELERKSDGRVGGQSNNGQYWIINPEMRSKFGDGRLHEFDCEPKGRPESSYTHRGEDGWFYHQSWFVPEDSLNFGQPVEVSKEVVTIDIDSLDIPE